MADCRANPLANVIRTEALAAAGRAGLSERAAEDVAKSIWENVSLRLGGTDVYVPLRGQDREARNHRIRAEFNGRNHAELSRRFGLSVGSVYRILRGADR